MKTQRKQITSVPFFVYVAVGNEPEAISRVLADMALLMDKGDAASMTVTSLIIAHLFVPLLC